MVFCPYCWREMEWNATVCPNCTRDRPDYSNVTDWDLQNYRPPGPFKRFTSFVWRVFESILWIGYFLGLLIILAFLFSGIHC